LFHNVEFQYDCQFRRSNEREKESYGSRMAFKLPPLDVDVSSVKRLMNADEFLDIGPVGGIKNQKWHHPSAAQATNANTSIGNYPDRLRFAGIADFDFTPSDFHAPNPVPGSAQCQRTHRGYPVG